MSQWKLLKRRGFSSLFFTQLLGAFNDNLFKNALVIAITYRAASVAGLGPEQLVALSGGVFILPFFLFSATAGQIADRFAKSRVIRFVKILEIGIMSVAAYGFLTDQLVLLLVVLFLMGFQSAIFGPAKYSVLPELLEERDLVGGNAIVETGSFVAILLGTIAGALLISIEGTGPTILAVAVVVVAVLGFMTSTWMPKLAPAAPDLEITPDPIRPTLQTFSVTRKNRPVFLSILGISWFWFLGASLITLLPAYSKDVLHGGESVVTTFLALFCVGIAVGSLLCERMSHRMLELGLVPFGSIGMSLFLFDLFLVGAPELSGTELRSIGTLLGEGTSVRIVIDLAGLSIFGGFYTVPLYTMIQQRSAASERSRVIAGNNVLNAAFMVAASLMLIGLFAAGFSIPQIWGVLALLNAAVAVYIYTVIPEFLLRFGAWILANVMYRVRITGRDHIPTEGPAVLVCNHVTFIDWLIVASACPRPVRFVMYHGYFDRPVIRTLFRDAKVIPIAPAHESEAVLDAAFDRIAAELEDGEMVCIFPEGKLTKDGKMNPFRSGVERIVQRTPVPVIPMALGGMWGSFFSKGGGKAFSRIWSRVSLAIGAPVPSTEVDAADLQDRVAALGALDDEARASERVPA